MLNRLKDVFRSFQEHEVRYLVIGGIAAVIHGVPRATFDLDILIEATPENGKRLLDALVDAGMGTARLTDVESLLAHEITVFKDRVRVDVQTTTPGLSFREAWVRRETVTYDGQAVYLVSKEDLIASKKVVSQQVCNLFSEVGLKCPLLPEAP